MSKTDRIQYEHADKYRGQAQPEHPGRCNLIPVASSGRPADHNCALPFDLAASLGRGRLIALLYVSTD
jgi:hypothetical protein